MNDFKKIDIEFEEYINSIKKYYYKFIDTNDKNDFINKIKLETEIKSFSEFINQLKKEIHK